MIEDKDLDFLAKCNDNDLNNLVDILVYDKDGKKRVSETLSTTEVYKKHCPKHTEYCEEIKSELQCYGGNTMANLLRGGKGVPYREILEDVSSTYKIKVNKNINTETLEDLLLLSIIEHSLDKMNEEQRKELLHTLKVNTTDMSKKAMLSAIQIAIRAGGFTSYKLSVVIANSIVRQLTGKGIAFAGNQALTKSLSVLSGPIGWAITGLWTAYDISGPAYRVTVPAVLEIAYLRKEIKNREDNKGILNKIKNLWHN